MFLDGLDALDQKILSLLIENARYSYSEIGEKVGLSRVAVKSRIDAWKEAASLRNTRRLSTRKRSVGLSPAILKLRRNPPRWKKSSAAFRQRHRDPNLPHDRQQQPACPCCRLLAGSTGDLHPDRARPSARRYPLKQPRHSLPHQRCEGPTPVSL